MNAPRRAAPVDIPAIVRLTNLAFLAEQFCIIGERTDAADVGARMAAGAFYVIDDEAAPGALSGSAFTSVEGGRGYMGLLSVDPSRQGRGLSRVLLAAVEAHCRGAGCAELDITVINLREPLFAVYRKLGFVESGVVPFPVPERARMPLHLVRMTKALTGA